MGCYNELESKPSRFGAKELIIWPSYDCQTFSLDGSLDAALRPRLAMLVRQLIQSGCTAQLQGT
eukprot:2905986-Amphidinium_carterae.1